jgi:hypothetical protein
MMAGMKSTPSPGLSCTRKDGTKEQSRADDGQQPSRRRCPAT